MHAIDFRYCGRQPISSFIDLYFHQLEALTKTFLPRGNARKHDASRKYLKTAEKPPERQKLNAQCAAVRDGFMAGIPTEQRDTLMAAGQRMAESGVTNNMIIVGNTAPTFTLTDVTGRPFQPDEALTHGPIVLNFYRGGWCPFCNLALKALADREPEMRKLGARLVAVSPELHEQNQAVNGDLNLPFSLLFDEGNQVAREYGLVMQVDAAVQPLYQQWGV